MTNRKFFIFLQFFYPFSVQNLKQMQKLFQFFNCNTVTAKDAQQFNK